YAAMVEERLEQLDLLAGHGGLGLVVDQTFDLARVFFLANTTLPIPGHDGTAGPRSADVIDTGNGIVQVGDLAARAPAHAKKTSTAAPRKSPSGLARAAKRFLDATERWNADHPHDYPPPGSGICPMCRHRDCFG